MPEGKLRSGVYRSFIMCDDPRGVVESYGAIKKKQSHKTRTSICNGTSTTNQPSLMAPRKSTEEAPSSSSLQLLRVSKGIQKLNVAIESWSKEVVRPEDIAKDLLRGALDLEESLAMLTSLQEDDHNKRKPRISSKDGRSELRFQRSMSDRFGERIEKRMMSRESVEPKDCYDELRKVIRESFVRQNLLLPETTRSNTRVVRSDFASSSGAASSSTSSSQSSMVSGSTKSSASSDVPRKAPSLIARLMGLDVSSSSPQEPNKTTVIHIDKPDIFKKTKKESLEVVRRNNSTREAVVQENPSTIVLIRPMMRVVQPEMERLVLPRKPRMQGEVHPRMMNQRKDHQAKGASKTSRDEMKLPLTLTKKDREPKEMVRKVEQNEGKVIKRMSPSNAKDVIRERKPIETKQKLPDKKEDTDEGKDRYRKPPNNPTTNKISSNPSNMSRKKIQRSRLSSSSSSDEQKSSNTRLKNSREASKPNAKKKLHQQDNDLASENNSGSSQDTRGSLNQLSAEETTSSELHIHGHCENGEVNSCAAITQHSLEQEASQMFLKSFLSSSQDFISYAENLFDFNTNTNTKRNQESNRDGIVILDQILALDFAKEVAKRRSLLLIAKPTCPQRRSVNFDELLMEVCEGFESLRSYRDALLGQSSFVKESIHMVLEKDLKSNKTEMTSGVWDLGWRNEFQIDETHQAVADLEKLILSGLIQEIFS